jgi:hypothetical protein
MLNFSLEIRQNLIGADILNYLQCSLLKIDHLTLNQKLRIERVFKEILKEKFYSEVKCGAYSVPLGKAGILLKTVVSAKQALSQEGIFLKTHYLALYQILTHLKEEKIISQDEEALFFNGLGD